MAAIRLATALMASVLLSACALSPQTVTLAPTISVAAENIGQGRTVKVLATDTRSNDLVGTRGGIYEKTSVIRTGNDVADAIRIQALKGLQSQGFVDGGNEAATIVRIKLTEIAYSVPAGAVATSADMAVAVEITAERNGSKQTGTYRSEMNRRFPVTPTEAQNQAWLNELLAETLQRFFIDPKMRTFLTQPAPAQ